jgi:hypothetical protein
MFELFDFCVQAPLDRFVIEKGLADNFNCKSFCWVNDFFEYASENEPDWENVYLSLAIAEDGFKYIYSVFGKGSIPATMLPIVEMLKQLAKNEETEIITADDDMHPDCMILIEPNGHTSTVLMKTAQYLVIEEFYNYPLGDFRTEKPITEADKEILRELIAFKYPGITIWEGADGPCINGPFNKVKADFHKLKNFDWHYEIRPEGKNEWLVKFERIDLFKSLMHQFYRSIQKDLCLFPRNYTEIKGEEYCIVLSGMGEEKIVYYSSGAI